MSALTQTTLSAQEQRLLERYVRRLQERLGPELHGVWLFGSRARGEEPAKYSDVDVMVFVQHASWDERMGVRAVLDEVAGELGLGAVAVSFSIHVHTPGWLARRREIESFFIAEVDRDKVVLQGEA